MFGDVCCDTESLEWQFCSVSPSMCFRASKMVGVLFLVHPAAYRAGLALMFAERS